MAAERQGPTRLDRTHDAALGAAEVTGMFVAVGFAVAAEYVRHLEGGHDRRGSGRTGTGETVPRLNSLAHGR